MKRKVLISSILIIAVISIFAGIQFFHKDKKTQAVKNPPASTQDMTNKELKSFLHQEDVQEAMSDGERGIEEYNATHKTKIKLVEKKKYIGYLKDGKKLYCLEGENSSLDSNNIKIFQTEQDAKDAGYSLDTSVN